MLSLSFKSVHEKVWKKEVQVMIHNCGNNYGMYKSVAMGFKTSLQQTRHQLHGLNGHILNVSKHFSTLGHLLHCLWLLKSLFTLCAVFQKSHNTFHLSCSVYVLPAKGLDIGTYSLLLSFSIFSQKFSLSGAS